MCWKARFLCLCMHVIKTRGIGWSRGNHNKSTVTLILVFCYNIVDYYTLAYMVWYLVVVDGGKLAMHYKHTAKATYWRGSSIIDTPKATERQQQHRLHHPLPYKHTHTHACTQSVSPNTYESERKISLESWKSHGKLCNRLYIHLFSVHFLLSIPIFIRG